MKVLILQGGHNEEHKVSLNTAKQIGRALKTLKIDFKNFNVKVELILLAINDIFWNLLDFKELRWNDNKKSYFTLLQAKDDMKSKPSKLVKCKFKGFIML